MNCRVLGTRLRVGSRDNCHSAGNHSQDYDNPEQNAGAAKIPNTIRKIELYWACSSESKCDGQYCFTDTIHRMRIYTATKIGVAARGQGSWKNVVESAKLSTMKYQSIQHSAPV